MTKPVVLIAEELSQPRSGPRAGLRGPALRRSRPPALLPALADADAVLIRSATMMDAEAIAAGPRLRVIARAGVGLDNVDVPAATKAGVMVVNAPTSNITSAAELAVGLLLACAQYRPRQRGAQGWGVEAQQVWRRRAARQDRRGRRPRADRPADRAAAQGLRHECHRL